MKLLIVENIIIEELDKILSKYIEGNLTKKKKKDL